ncbi:MAG TPA: cyclic pyranopterin monophosphate synthase MoaC [Candidatus Thermoplasmatota archaeon]|nr:cyclic pyranopterin monophosphate synthase MoaC [Candidatus Thermoplasmatota archaeon]
MIDVGGKPAVRRVATARGRLKLKRTTLSAVRAGRIKKGDVLEVSRVAAVQAVKRTPEILPLCHPIPLEGIDVKVRAGASHLEVEVRVSAHWKTGVEMEALVGAAAALLTAWDMTKYLEKDKDGQYPSTVIEAIRVVSKQKGGA